MASQLFNLSEIVCQGGGRTVAVATTRGKT